MNDEDGFIYEEAESFADEDEKTLKGLKQSQQIDPVTGRKKKKENPLNKKELGSDEFDAFMESSSGNVNEFFMDF